MAHRLRAARGQLVLQHLFLGALLLRLSMRPYERCRSIATDGAEIYYHRAFLKDLSLGDIQLRKPRTVGRACLVVALSSIVWIAVTRDDGAKNRDGVFLFLPQAERGIAMNAEW